MRLERLTAQHPVEAFSCGARPGADEITRFLQTQALAEQSAGLSSVTLAIDHDAGGRIVGFYSLSPLSIRVDEAVRNAVGMPSAPYPSIGGYLLGRLGVAVGQQGKDYGALLVERAIDAARKAQTAMGGVFLAVDPKNAKLLSWYLRLGFGFVQLDPRRHRILMRL